MVLCFVPRLLADAKIKFRLTENAEQVTIFLIYAAGSQYLEPHTDDVLDESDLLCIYKSHNSLLWLLVFMMFLTGKPHVCRTGTINISTSIAFRKMNARRNLDLER